MTDFFTNIGATPPQDLQPTLSQANLLKYCDQDVDQKGGPKAIALGPSSNVHIQTIKTMFENDLGLSTRYFETNVEMDEYVSSIDYYDDQKICFGIFINESTSDRWDYHLRFFLDWDENKSDLYPTMLPRS